MLELPEALTIARHLQETLAGKTVKSVIAAASPHKFAWYHGDPADYPARLAGSDVLSAEAHGGIVQVNFTRANLTFSDGVNLRYIEPGNAAPAKHQLLLVFTDGSALAASVQMYGGLLCWDAGEELDNPYYQVACQKPSPLDDDLFTEVYFIQLLAGPAVQKLLLCLRRQHRAQAPTANARGVSRHHGTARGRPDSIANRRDSTELHAAGGPGRELSRRYSPAGASAVGCRRLRRRRGLRSCTVNEREIQP